jgi:hypothetical protein
MIHLFNDNEDWTDKAKQYDIEVSNLLRPIIERANQEGVSLRDLHTVINSSVQILILSEILGWTSPPKIACSSARLRRGSKERTANTKATDEAG